MKKKILAFTPIFYPHMGGAERTVYELYSRLVRDHGYEVALVTINTDHAPSYEMIDGIHVYRIGKNYTNKLVKIAVLQVLFFWIYVQKFSFRGWRVLHVHYAFHLSLSALFFRYILQKKLIVSEYHFGTGADISSEKENPSLVNTICGMVYRAAALVLTISQDNKRFIHTVSKKDISVEVIKQGTDHIFFSPKYFNAQKKQELLYGKEYLLVTTSRISTRKNIEDMIRVVRIVKDRGISVRLMINGKVDRGNETYFAELKGLIHELALDDAVVFNGFVSDEDMRVLYACSDLFLLTSKYEGFGIANVEALASGTPVVTYDTGAAHDFIRDYDNGVVTANNDPIRMADIVEKILKDGELLPHMRHAARACVEKELNWATYAKENNIHITPLFN
ncbi:MAG: glycosyltransferase family 4 protein [Candidatus Magasanikbacteria bacterium]|nr:glycosyltransferase family 4 protein [Candidatus Magasanikbacteria bacterium]